MVDMLMIDGARRRQLIGQSLYIALGLAILFLQLLPLTPGKVSWPGPDLLLCLTLAWVVRRPEQVPAPIVAAMFLIENLLLSRPIGLWAAIVLMTTEMVRQNDQRWRDQPFLLEWLRIGLLVLGSVMLDRLVQVAFFVPETLAPRSPLGQVLMNVIATVAAYPAVVLAARWLVGLRRPRPGDNPASGI